MKKNTSFLLSLIVIVLAWGCVDNDLAVEPLDDNYPFRLVLDEDEGADLPDAEDVSVTVVFADFMPDDKLPQASFTLDYAIVDAEDDMEGNVSVDKIVYKVEIDDCEYEHELEFTPSADGLSGTITVSADPDLGSVPTEIEIVLALPGLDDTEGAFKVQLSNLRTTDNLILGSPLEFEYSVLDNDVAGEWELELQSEEEFERFKEVFAPLNAELEELAFEEITGLIVAEFEFGEMKFLIELVETTEETSCEDGEIETETVNKVIEIEAEYDAEDGEIEWEGSHELVEDGEVEGELDFILEGEYETDGTTLVMNFLKAVDEDNFKDGEELFASEEGISFTFEKD